MSRRRDLFSVMAQRKKSKINRLSSKSQSSSSSNKHRANDDRGSIPSNPIWIVSLLVIAIGVMGKWYWDDDPESSSFGETTQLGQLLQNACATTGFKCHPAIYAENRTLFVNQDIPQYTLLFDIPTSGFLTDTDAACDSWMQEHLPLSKAVHPKTGESIGTRPYLAAYLARLLRKTSQSSSKHQSQWLQYLPTRSEMKSFHPVFRDRDELANTLGQHSLAYATAVYHRRDRFDSEYKAFQNIFPAINEQFTYDDLLYARVLQISRSLSFPPEAEPNAAMTLLIDAFDHTHEPRDNVGYFFHPNTGTFQAMSKVPIKAGETLSISYGNKTDSLLYANYGFVTGEQLFRGASLAVHHSVHRKGVDVPNQNSDLVEYLRFDDGYESCITEDLESPAARLKFLKFTGLQLMASTTAFWFIEDPFENLDDVSLEKVMSLCRLIAMNERDLKSRSYLQLKSRLNKVRSGDFSALLLDVDNESWDLRSKIVLKRLASRGIALFASSSQKEAEKLKLLEKHSTEWSVSTVRLGELTVLERLVELADESLNHPSKKSLINDPPSEDYFVRSEPCPKELSSFIVQNALPVP